MMYRVGIDVGGAFTDFLLVRDDGSFSTYKTFTSTPDQSVGIMEGLARFAEAEGTNLPQFPPHDRADPPRHDGHYEFGAHRFGCTHGIVDDKGISRCPGDASRSERAHIRQQIFRPASPRSPLSPVTRG